MQTRREDNIQRRPVLVLDDGGVISDNSLRAEQWQRLVGEYFAPILGGRPEEWAEANRVVATSFFVPEAWQARLDAATDYHDFERIYFLDWLGGMCQVVGIPQPSEEESITLARRATIWITSRVQAAFPGAADAIHMLHSRGYTLHTASGESSADLEGYLGAMGVRACFHRLYGPDLINTLKSGREFYERILEDARVEPDEALVVDDNPAAISWASAAGARTVLVGNHQTLNLPGFITCIGSLAELPALLESLPPKA